MTTLALDIQTPSTVRTCHSVGTTRSRETGVDCNGRNRVPSEKSTWGFFHARRSIGNGAFSGDIVPSSTTKFFLILIPK